MKFKNIYKFFHDTDPDVEKQIVKVNKKNINDITYKSYSKINGKKFHDITAKEDGNGIEVISLRRTKKLKLDYDEVVALYATLDSVMTEMGFISSEATFYKDR